MAILFDFTKINFGAFILQILLSTQQQLYNNFAVKMDGLVCTHPGTHTLMHTSREWMKMINVYTLCGVSNFQLPDIIKCTHHECHPEN